MNDKELLLQELKQEAENIKGIIHNEVESFVEKLSNISLSDFSPRFFPLPILTVKECFSFAVKKCFSELERRIRTFNTDFVEKLKARLHQTNLFRYNIVKTAESRMKYNLIIDTYSPIINLKELQTKALAFPYVVHCSVVGVPNVKHICEKVFQEEVKSHRNEIVKIYAFELFKPIDEIISKLENAVTYKHIENDFGKGFLFSPQMMKVTENDVNNYMNAEKKDTDQLSDLIVSVLKSEKYSKMISVNRDIPTFDSYDRECDSWHKLYLLRESSGIIRAVYCTGGYKIARIEGYAEVYEYPEYLEKYFK